MNEMLKEFTISELVKELEAAHATIARMDQEIKDLKKSKTVTFQSGPELAEKMAELGKMAQEHEARIRALVQSEINMMRLRGDLKA